MQLVKLNTLRSEFSPGRTKSPLWYLRVIVATEGQVKMKGVISVKQNIVWRQNFGQKKMSGQWENAL
jgi:hypothetical protein